MITTQDLENYIKEVKQASDNYDKQYNFTISKEFTFTVGKKNAKIISNYNGQKSAHCFISLDNGDIFKASGWNVPAKGVRGNIFNENKPLLGGDFYRR